MRNTSLRLTLRVVPALLAVALLQAGPARGQSDTFSVVAPWVVTVSQTDGKEVSRGSGLVHSSGLVITAAHVILQSSLPARVGRQGRTAPATTTVARVVRINRDADVAVLDAGYPPGLTLEDFPARSGDEVWVFGYEYYTQAAILRMARGSIGQRWRDFFQVDAAVQSGFSGGPITTRGGRVVGILSFGTRANPNLAYLVPAHVLEEELRVVTSGVPGRASVPRAVSGRAGPSPTPAPSATRIFEEALQVARSITDEFIRSVALWEIARAMARAGRWQQALQVAWSITDEPSRSLALSEVASAMARAGNTARASRILQEALQVAQSITDEFSRSLALSQIAQGMLGILDTAQQEDEP